MNRYQQRESVLKSMGFATYADYLQSPLWAKVRRRLFKRCSTCPCGKPATEAHHMSYKRRYLEGRGKIHKFIVPVCRACHQRIEFDAGGKTALGHANRILHEIRAEAEARGVRLPWGVMAQPSRKRRKSPTSGRSARKPLGSEPGQTLVRREIVESGEHAQSN